MEWHIGKPPVHAPVSMGVLKFITHSKRATLIAKRYGWLPGARYTNLRDVRSFDRIGFLDIHWSDYRFCSHVAAAKVTRPLLTVARDFEREKQLVQILDEADELALYADRVIIVPKDPRTKSCINEMIPDKFLLGYSVPSRYGKTPIEPEYFRRPVHLLGGRPDVQRQLGERMSVYSLDCNRFTLDAEFGDYFDGERFRPHPAGGYVRCLVDSIRNINKIWSNYYRRAKQPNLGKPYV